MLSRVLLLGPGTTSRLLVIALALKLLLILIAVLLGITRSFSLIGGGLRLVFLLGRPFRLGLRLMIRLPLFRFTLFDQSRKLLESFVETINLSAELLALPGASLLNDLRSGFACPRVAGRSSTSRRSKRTSRSLSSPLKLLVLFVVLLRRHRIVTDGVVKQMLDLVLRRGSHHPPASASSSSASLAAKSLSKASTAGSAGSSTSTGSSALGSTPVSPCGMLALISLSAFGSCEGFIPMA